MNTAPSDRLPQKKRLKSELSGLNHKWTASRTFHRFQRVTVSIAGPDSVFIEAFLDHSSQCVIQVRLVLTTGHAEWHHLLQNLIQVLARPREDTHDVKFEIADLIDQIFL